MTDPHRGQGGSYTIDPATGERKLEERTAPQQEAQASEPNETDQPADQADKPRKGK